MMIASSIGPLAFLALAFPDRRFLGLSLDVFDTFVGPSFSRTLPI